MCLIYLYRKYCSLQQIWIYFITITIDNFLLIALKPTWSIHLGTPLGI
jgi:hypothetical protein